MKNPLSKKKTKKSEDPSVDAAPEVVDGADPKKSKKVKKPAVSASMKKTLLAVGAAAVLAVSGMLMLVSYVQSAEEAAEPPPEIELADVVKVNTPIPAGTTLEALAAENFASFKIGSVPADQVPTGALTSIPELSSMGDLMAGRDLVANESVFANQFEPREQFATQKVALPVADDHHLMSFQVPAHRIMGGDIRAPGEISISATFGGNGGFPPLAAVVLTEVDVVAVAYEGELPPEPDPTAEGYVPPRPDALQQARTGTFLVTVAVTAEELAKLHYTIDYGNILVAAATKEPVADIKAVATIDDILADAGATLDENGELEIKQQVRTPAQLAFEAGQSLNPEFPADGELNTDETGASEALFGDGGS